MQQMLFLYISLVIFLNAENNGTIIHDHSNLLVLKLLHIISDYIFHLKIIHLIRTCDVGTVTKLQLKENILCICKV